MLVLLQELQTDALCAVVLRGAVQAEGEDGYQRGSAHTGAERAACRQEQQRKSDHARQPYIQPFAEFIVAVGGAHLRKPLRIEGTDIYANEGLRPAAKNIQDGRGRRVRFLR